MLRVPFDCPPGMKVHPALDLIPMMGEDDFDRLVWSIRKIGLVDPIVVHDDGLILDGRCRLQACEIARIKPKLAPPKDPVAAFIFARNIARRNLNHGQRAIIIARLMDKIEKGVLHDDGLAYFILEANFARRHLTASQLQIAEAIFEERFGEADYPERLVSPEARLIARHRYIAEQVRDGVLSIGAAYERATEYELEIAKRDEDHQQLVQLRGVEPFLAIRVDEGELTLDQAIAAAEDKAIAPVLAEHAEAIRVIGKRVKADIIEIGRRLIECKAVLRHGEWLPWLEREFGWTDETARRFMQVAELDKSHNLLNFDLPISGFYLLAKPSTPETVRDDVLRRAEAGELLSVSDIKRAIDEARGRPSKEPPGDRLRMLRDLSERMSQARPDDPLVRELRQLMLGDE